MSEGSHWHDCYLAHHECAIAKVQQLEQQLIEQSEHVQMKWAPPAVVAGMKAEIKRLEKELEAARAAQEQT